MNINTQSFADGPLPVRKKQNSANTLLWIWVTLSILFVALAVTVTTAQADDGRSTIPDPGRVTDDLLALYTFEEGRGAVVQDVSGVGDPLDLYIFDGTAVTWGEDALTLDSPTAITSAFPADKIRDRVVESNEITLEAWVRPTSAYRYGPARIVTISENANKRNMTLGQRKKNWATVYDVRLRTTATNDNGTPSVFSPVGSLTTELAHVVYTRDSEGNATIYLDGVPVAVDTVPGRLANWDEDYRLALGDELNGKRSWLGEYHLVAFYGKALSASEVIQNYQIGAGNDPGTPGEEPTPTPQPGDRITDGIQVLYTFEEGTGAIVHDVSGVGSPLDLFTQDGPAIRWEAGTLALDRPTLITSAFPAKKIYDASTASKELTIETWITPEEINQKGPARIVSMSLNPHQRNFTLGHDKYARYDVRLRTTDTSQNGVPSTKTANGVVTTDLTHVVYTRSAAGLATLYVNGVPKAVRSVDGSFGTWDDDYRLALANEQTHNRAWMGAYHLVAIYSRSLSPAEVNTNYAAGPRDGESVNLPDEPGPVEGSPAIDGSVVINLGTTTDEGAIHTTGPQLALALDATSSEGAISRYRASTDLANLGAWKNYANQADLTVDDEMGQKRVYVQYQDNRGNVSSVYSDTILLDSSAGTDFGISINSGAAWTNSTTVMLTLPAEPTTAQMQVSNDGGFIGVPWEPFTLHKSWETISYGTELIQPVVYVRFRNVDGETSPPYQDDIILDLQAPDANVVDIGMDDSTAGLSIGAMDDDVVPVRVAWSSTDNLSGVRWHDVQVKIGDDDWTDWLFQTIESEAFFDAVPGETYSFRVRSEDEAGNWSEYSTGSGVLSISVPDADDTPPSTNKVFMPGVFR